MDKLHKCVQSRHVNHSQSREVVYKIIYQSQECLSVPEIITLTQDESPQKISINTVYRHLRFLVECGLVFTIQDDLKKAYYCLCREEAALFSVCPKCNKIEKMQINLCDVLKDSMFVTVHKKCSNCK